MIPSIIILQLRFLGFQAPIINLKNTGEEGVKYLCFVYVSICVVTNLVK